MLDPALVREIGRLPSPLAEKLMTLAEVTDLRESGIGYTRIAEMTSLTVKEVKEILGK